jgi:hypothetical protein
MIDIPPYPKPPAQVAPYVDVLGLEYALKFLEAFGGVEVYIAQDPTYKGELVKVVGYANALALGSIANRLQRRVPLAKEWRAHVYKSQGLSTNKIARKLGVSDVTARAYLKGYRDPKDPFQLTLF